MPRSYSSTTVDADPENVWALLRDFDGAADLSESIVNSMILDGKRADQVGAQRRLTMQDGSSVHEQLVALSDLERSYTYILLQSPFPLTGYCSTIRVSPVTDQASSFVEWWSTYDCEAADAPALDELLTVTLYGGTLAAVKARFVLTRSGADRP